MASSLWAACIRDVGLFMFLKHSQSIGAWLFSVDSGSFGDICLCCHLQSQLWTLSHFSGSVLCAWDSLCDQTLGSHLLLWAAMLSCWVCEYQVFLPRTATVMQQSTQHNRTVIEINRVSLDSSYCVIRCFLSGKDGPSVRFMWQCLPGALIQAERSEEFQAIRQRVGHLVWHF